MLLVCVLLTSSLLGAIGAVDTGFFSAHKDSDRWILSFSWLHLSGGTSTPESATNRPPDDGCCDKKVVGGEVYLRADVADNIDMTDCIEGCAYRWKTWSSLPQQFFKEENSTGRRHPWPGVLLPERKSVLFLPWSVIRFPHNHFKSKKDYIMKNGQFHLDIGGLGDMWRTYLISLSTMFISIMSLSTMSKEWERVHGLGGKNEIEIEDLRKFFDFGISYPLAVYSF